MIIRVKDKKYFRPIPVSFPVINASASKFFTFTFSLLLLIMNPIIPVDALYALARDKPIGIPILADVVYYLKRSPGLNGKDLAKRLEVKRIYLSHAIELLTGVNLVTMLREWRLLHVKYMLTETSYSYDYVAKVCGFSGNRTMSRFLERYTGCTAYEYRLGRSNGHRGACS